MSTGEKSRPGWKEFDGTWYKDRGTNGWILEAWRLVTEIGIEYHWSADRQTRSKVFSIHNRHPYTDLGRCQLAAEKAAEERRKP